MKDFDLTTLTIYLNKSQLEKLSILAKSDNPFEVESFANNLFTEYLLYKWLKHIQENLNIED